jgi:hypothetical protein
MMRVKIKPRGSPNCDRFRADKRLFRWADVYWTESAPIHAHRAFESALAGHKKEVGIAVPGWLATSRPQSLSPSEPYSMAKLSA